MKLFKIAALFTLVCLSGCGPVECINADDWGDQFRIYVDAQCRNEGGGSDVVNLCKTTDSAKCMGPESGKPSSDFLMLQGCKWQKKYVTDGQDLVVVLENSGHSNLTLSDINDPQCSALDDQNSWTATSLDLAGRSVERAQFSKNSPCVAGANNQATAFKSDLPIINPFSRIDMGLGLYLSVCNQDLNDKGIGALSTNHAQSFCPVFHLGSAYCPNGSQCDSGFESYGCPTAGIKIPKEQFAQFFSSPLHFKILDRYYADNRGGYAVLIKKGVRPPEGQIFARAVGIINLTICNASKAVYKTAASNSSFMKYIKALLMLYVIGLGIGFVFALIEIKPMDLVIRTIKIGLILVLISPASWQFFNDHMFAFFRNGVSEITNMMYSGATPEAASSKSLSSSDCESDVSAFDQIDHVFRQLLSRSTSRKVFALVGWNFWIGLPFAIVFYGLIVLTLLIIAKSVLLFLLSYLAMGLVIAVAPLFMSFMLLEVTNQWFKAWLKQLIFYFVQPLVILAFAFFVLKLIKSEAEFLLGYRVCWKPTEVCFFGDCVHSWQPDIEPSSQRCLYAPNVRGERRWTRSCGTETEQDCSEYSCKRMRYPAYPYLGTEALKSPEIEDKELQKDAGKIRKFQANVLMEFKDVLYLMLLALFLYKFNEIVPTIASALAGGEINSPRIASMYEAAKSGATNLRNTMQSASYEAINPLYKKVTGRAGIREDVAELKSNLAERTNRIKAQAYEGANKIYVGTVGKLIPGSQLSDVAKAVSKVRHAYGIASQWAQRVSKSPSNFIPLKQLGKFAIGKMRGSSGNADASRARQGVADASSPPPDQTAGTTPPQDQQQ